LAQAAFFHLPSAKMKLLAALIAVTAPMGAAQVLKTSLATYVGKMSSHRRSSDPFPQTAQGEWSGFVQQPSGVDFNMTLSIADDVGVVTLNSNDLAFHCLGKVTALTGVDILSGSYAITKDGSSGSIVCVPNVDFNLAVMTPTALKIELKSPSARGVLNLFQSVLPRMQASEIQVAVLGFAKAQLPAAVGIADNIEWDCNCLGNYDVCGDGRLPCAYTGDCVSGNNYTLPNTQSGSQKNDRDSSWHCNCPEGFPWCSYEFCYQECQFPPKSTFGI